MSDRKGIEIDFCGQCRGVWLDKGELDKIIDLSINERVRDSNRRLYGSDTGRNSQQTSFDVHDNHSSHRREQYKYKKPYYKYKKKKTVLGEIFDIFD
jgi:Zn-finger nucleic acid-binding protein